jgi:penicillin-binding protein 1A
MTRVFRVVAVIAIVVLTLPIGLTAWLYFYTADLPSVSQLNEFNPVSEAKARLRSCDGAEQAALALPREKLGRYMVAALVAAEGKPDSRSPFLDLFGPLEERHVATYQLQLARSLVCPSGPILKRELRELRLANAINRRFAQPELLTIYLNRVYLGPETYGVEAAAEKYFGKPASRLTLEETAVIVGTIRAPGIYSPVTHPDRAAQRRNAILDEMVLQRSVLEAEADLAKAAPIRVLQ